MEKSIDMMNSQQNDVDQSVLIMAHRSAVRMVAYEGRTFWNATAVYVQLAFLLIAGGVFPSFAGSSEPGLVALGGIAVSSIGLLLTLLWLAMIARVRKYQRYWILSAREIERKLPDRAQMFVRGEKLAEGDTVEVDNERIKFTYLERVRMRWAVPVLYAAFIFVFLILLILNFLRVLEAY